MVQLRNTLKESTQQFRPHLPHRYFSTNQEKCVSEFPCRADSFHNISFCSKLEAHLLILFESLRITSSDDEDINCVADGATVVEIILGYIRLSVAAQPLGLSSPLSPLRRAISY